MRHLVPLGLAAALLTSACEAFGAARGLAIATVLLTGALAWLAHREQAHAGGSTGSTGSGTTDTSTGSGTTDTGTTSSTGAGPLDSTATSGGTVDSPATTGTTTDESTETGPCLSINPTGTETGEPELLPCLCACDTDGSRTAADWAPAVLLPALALRRRSRRRSLDRLAASGRLPADVVARLRRRLEHDDRSRAAHATTPDPEVPNPASPFDPPA